MSDESKPASATPTSPSGETAPAGEATEPKPSAAKKLVAAAQPKVKQAIEFTKAHPLGAVATVAAAAALVEVEFAVGIITGIGATALLARESGPKAREKVVAGGKRAYASARGAFARRAKPAAPGAPATATSTTEAAPPPAA